MLDWIFEGIVTWINSVVTDLMDAVSGLFLNALGTDMTVTACYECMVFESFQQFNGTIRRKRWRSFNRSGKYIFMAILCIGFF